MSSAHTSPTSARIQGDSAQKPQTHAQNPDALRSAACNAIEKGTTAEMKAALEALSVNDRTAVSIAFAACNVTGLEFYPTVARRLRKAWRISA